MSEKRKKRKAKRNEKLMKCMMESLQTTVPTICVLEFESTVHSAPSQIKSHTK